MQNRVMIGLGMLKCVAKSLKQSSLFTAASGRDDQQPARANHKIKE